MSLQNKCEQPFVPFNFILMLSTTYKTESTATQTNAHKPHSKQQCIFALLMDDKRIVIGQSDNAARIVAHLNSGGHKLFRRALCVSRIIGIREVTETRTLPSVVAQFCKDFSEERVVCI